MDKITDEIWIGSFVDARDLKALRQNGIRSILCLDGSLLDATSEKLGVDRIEVIKLIDGHGNSPAVFLRAVRLLKEMSLAHPPVLVQCHAGQSRSAAVVCKLLMKEEGNSLADAMQRITVKRKVAIQAGLQEALDF
jgi:protein-tyrosine phosphatase